MNVTLNPHFQLETARARQSQRMNAAAAWRLAHQRPADVAPARRALRLAPAPAFSAAHAAADCRVA
jgi:hypothetical protein